MSAPRTRRRHSLWFAVATVLLLSSALVTGCGDSAGSTTTAAPGTTAGPATTVAPGSTAPGGPRTIQVIMTNRSYDPKDVTINVGDTVMWVNEDAPRHDVVADNGEFKSELFDEGGTFSFTFDTPGTYPYHCSIHPGMEGTVIVE